MAKGGLNSNQKFLLSSGNSHPTATSGQPMQVIDLPGIMALPPGHAKRKGIERILDKVAGVIRGFLARQRYRKLRFIYLLTGTKAFNISDDDLLEIP